MSFPSMRTRNSQMVQCPTGAKKIKCPYVSKHRVQPSKFISHLQKCVKTLSPKYLKQFRTCRYHSLHIFSIHEIDAHEMSCPNKQNMETLYSQLVDESKILMEEISHSSEHSAKGSCRNECVQQKKDQDVFICYQQQSSNKDSSHSIKRNQVINRTPKGQLQDTLFCQEATEVSIQRSQDNHNQKQQKYKGTYYNKHGDRPKIGYNVQKTQSISNKYKINFEAQADKKSQPKQRENQRQKRKHKPENQHPDQNYQNIQLEQCRFCSLILSRPDMNIMKNKKLIKYFKAYRKLQQEQKELQKQLQQFYENLPLCFGGKKKSTNQQSTISKYKNERNTGKILQKSKRKKYLQDSSDDNQQNLNKLEQNQYGYYDKRRQNQKAISRSQIKKQSSYVWYAQQNSNYSMMQNQLSVARSNAKNHSIKQIGQDSNSLNKQQKYRVKQEENVVKIQELQPIKSNRITNNVIKIQDDAIHEMVNLVRQINNHTIKIEHDDQSLMIQKDNKKTNHEKQNQEIRLLQKKQKNVNTQQKIKPAIQSKNLQITHTQNRFEKKENHKSKSKKEKKKSKSKNKSNNKLNTCWILIDD